MKPSDLVITMLEHANKLHPSYTHEQCLTWALAMLAEVIFEKNQMDSIVFDRLFERIDLLYTTHHHQVEVKNGSN
jgi:hypothetical protein